MNTVIILLALAQLPTGETKFVLGRAPDVQSCIEEREAMREALDKMKAIGQVVDYYLRCEPIELQSKPKT